LKDGISKDLSSNLNQKPILKVSFLQIIRKSQEIKQLYWVKLTDLLNRIK